MKICFYVVCFWIFASIIAVCQQSPTTVPATIHFTFDNVDLAVPHYEILLDAQCQAHYQSRSKTDAVSDPSDGLTRAFTLSAATCGHIFDLAKQADYFHGSFDYTEHRVAFTGKKTLTFVDTSHNETASFNWSENKYVMELAEIFQGISTTLEKEPVLLRLRRFDKLGLNAELANMERQAAGGWLRELKLISPTLKSIANDPTIMTVARRRADYLLQLAASQP